MTDINQQTMEALNALREEVKTITPRQDVIEKCNDFLDKQEALNQKSFLEKQKAENDLKDLKEYVQNLEADIKRSNIKSEAEKSEEIKAFENYFFKKEIDKKYLRTDNNVAGGFLVPTEKFNEILKKITETSNIRSVARVRSLNTKSGDYALRNVLLSSSWSGEGETMSSSESAYGEKKLTAKTLSVTVTVTSDLIEDSNVNIINEVFSDAAEEFALREGNGFVLGNGGSKQPEGFMNNSDITYINSGSANNLTFDAMVKITGELKSGYNPIYAFNRRTLASIRLLTSSTGHYIWQGGNLGAGIPNVINGYNYIILPDMPDIGANTYPVIFADFNKGYIIGDRLGMSMLRDDNTLADQAKTRLIFRKRLDGAVAMPEAFIKLKCAS